MSVPCIDEGPDFLMFCRMEEVPRPLEYVSSADRASQLIFGQIYEETCNNLQARGLGSEHDVLVLRGGFTQFQAKYKVNRILQHDHGID